MFPENHYELMAEYNRWMDGKLYDICSRIPDNDRKKDMGAYFKSIHGTLNHIYYGGIAWLERLRDNRFTPRKLGAEIFEDFDDLRAAQERLDLELIEWAGTLTREYLETEYEYVSNVDGKTRKLPRWILAAHLFNHQTHHRGQLTTLIMQLGIDPGITDIPWLPSLERKGKS